MIKKNKDSIKLHKYPINNEFGIYKIYKIPFNEIIFKNADRLMSVIPKTLKETKKISFKTFYINKIIFIEIFHYVF